MLERLGLQASETNVDTIKRAFRTIALRVHPDKTGGSDAEFKRVLEAYEYLCMH
jgi:curved DNA-binding protein CbpA